MYVSILRLHVVYKANAIDLLQRAINESCKPHISSSSFIIFPIVYYDIDGVGDITKYYKIFVFYMRLCLLSMHICAVDVCIDMKSDKEIMLH